LPEKPEVISVSIDAAGKMHWNDTPMEQGDLKVKLLETVGKKPQPELNIRADKETRYKVLAEVMADVQNVGIAKLGFVSEPKSK
jgi:biopolymer transport protein ExbD